MKHIYNPGSTYRIQFHKDFTFSHLEKILPYLHKLGIKTIYASPVFTAEPGSLHGYDGTDPNTINPEIGTKEQLIAIAGKLKEYGMGWLQDIVPNHLAYHENNHWLMDVLAKGRASAYAKFFDIDWEHPEFNEKLMVPFPGSAIEKIVKDKFPDGYYQVTDWKDTDKRINYRRFFIVNNLICTNIQNDEVFAEYHGLIKELVEKDVFHGLRIDHVDGLADPRKYLADLRKLVGDKTYIVVEKILEPEENMPGDWNIEGNSGYDFMGMVNNLFTNRYSEYDLTLFYYDLTGDGVQVEKQIERKKSYILFTHMNGELNNLVRLYRSLTDSNIPDEQLKQHIADYLIDCPVYRYYGDSYPIMKIDKEKDPAQLRQFYQRCMQFTGPLMAKGVEDTLMYTYNRFIGHNEVGDSPAFFGYSPKQFHELMRYRQQHWPLSLNATSTHDTKRGEDARMRLNALTDLHEEWMSLVKHWQEINHDAKEENAPENNDEYFIYQTLIASYPVNDSNPEEYHGRLKEYLQKALREAKVHSGWNEPNLAYEEYCYEFARNITSGNTPFATTFRPFLRKVIDIGIKKSLGQLVLKFTCPGVPDIYQGTELWDLSLVDPDNRRPVDYRMREDMLVADPEPAAVWDNRYSGEVKLRLLQSLLRIRNEHAELFEKGDYVPLETEGRYAHHLIAFLRTYKRTAILVAVQVNHDIDDWENTQIILPKEQDSQWKDLLSNETVDVSSQKFLPGSVPVLLQSV